MARLINLTGNRYGILVVLSRGENIGKRPTWLCRCDCGNTKEIMGGHLKSGDVRSCGCASGRLKSESKTKYGINSKKISEYAIWISMKDRCRNPKHHAYKNYGGRGIKVCERWATSFEDFLTDIGARPSPKHSLDRHPDPNGDYEPGNVRWATRKEQARNMRSNRPLTFRGETRLMIEWAEITGINYYALSARLNRSGWSVERALTEPLAQTTCSKSEHEEDEPFRLYSD